MSILSYIMLVIYVYLIGGFSVMIVSIFEYRKDVKKEIPSAERLFKIQKRLGEKSFWMIFMILIIMMWLPGAAYLWQKKCTR